MTRYLSLIALVVIVLAGSSAFGQGGLVDRPDGSREFSLGKNNSIANWGDSNIELLNVAGEGTADGALKPWELTPDFNVMRRLHEKYPVNRWFRPREEPGGKFKLWMDGMPQLYRGGANEQFTSVMQPVSGLVDGKLDMVNDRRNFGPGGCKTRTEFYTFGFGTQMPVEQFRILEVPEEPGVATDNGYEEADCCADDGLPWSSYIPRAGELTGATDEPIYLVEAAAEHFQSGFQYRPLPVLLGRTDNVFRAPMVIDFPLQYYEMLRWKSFADTGEKDELGNVLSCGIVFQYFVGYGEMEIYGRGFPKEVTYLSQVQNLDEPHTLGRIFMDVSKWQRVGDEWAKTPVPADINTPEGAFTWGEWPIVAQISPGELVPAPDAAVAAVFRIKNGATEDTRAYTTWNELGELIQVPQSEWNALKVGGAQRFTFQGPVSEDIQNWSAWSGPQVWTEKMRDEGVLLGFPSRQYFQFEVRLKTEEMNTYAQIDSLWIEFFPQLADKLVGEVGLPGDLESRLAEVTIGDTTEFRYAILAELDAGSTGFDALRIDTPGKPEFLYLWKEDPTKDASLSLEERTRDITPSEIMEEANGLTLRLPANEAVRTGSEKIWVGFEAPIFNVIAQMSSAVFDWDETQASQENQLSQQVEEGNADDDIPTNQLRVIASGSAINDVITDLRFNTQSITPNGDTMNDELEISYTLFGVLNTEVEVTIYTLGGTPVFRKLATGQVAGFNPPITWNGTDDAGQLVQPGVYLVQVAAKTGVGSFEITRPIAMAY